MQSTEPSTCSSPPSRVSYSEPESAAHDNRISDNYGSYCPSKKSERVLEIMCNQIKQKSPRHNGDQAIVNSSGYSSPIINSPTQSGLSSVTKQRARNNRFRFNNKVRIAMQLNFCKCYVLFCFRCTRQFVKTYQA